MTYVEWLRVRNVLRVVAIILVVFLLAAGAFRIYIGQYDTVGKLISHIQLDPGTKTTTATLPDGTNRTTIDDPDGTHVVIEDRGFEGKTIRVIEPTGKRDNDLTHATIGSVHIDQSAKGRTTTTIVRTNGTTAFSGLLRIAGTVALIVATFLAAPFARENDGHLELALTRPASRVELALRTIGVDVLGLWIVAAMTIVAQILAQLMFEVPHYEFSDVVWSLAVAAIVPIAWYSLINAATASMKRAYGAIQGVAWPVAMLLLVLSEIPYNDSALGQAAKAVFVPLAYLNPLHYAQFQSASLAVNGRQLVAANLGYVNALAALILVLVYSAVAVLQWRRVEA
jgi:hypothetical protein